ncbi:hypothetical protein Hdeb2414_s0516g00908921 [Helianthus debilis subsp. tardiflorus]
MRRSAVPSPPITPSSRHPSIVTPFKPLIKLSISHNNNPLHKHPPIAGSLAEQVKSSGYTEDHDRNHSSTFKHLITSLFTPALHHDSPETRRCHWRNSKLSFSRFGSLPLTRSLGFG